MKKYINLFLQQTKQKQSVRILKKMQRIGFIVVPSLFVFIVLEWTMFYFLSRNLTVQEKLKNRYYGFILQNNQLDQKINTFLFKYTKLKQYMADDVNLYYYYSLLNTLITNIGSQGSLTKLKIATDQEVQFTLSFSNYEQALSFLDQMEKGSFIEYFDSIELTSLSIGKGSSQKFTLDFVGKLKKLTNAT